MWALGVVLIVLLELCAFARFRCGVAHHFFARMTPHRLRGVLAINGDDGVRRCHK